MPMWNCLMKMINDTSQSSRWSLHLMTRKCSFTQWRRILRRPSCMLYNRSVRPCNNYPTFNSGCQVPAPLTWWRYLLLITFWRNVLINWRQLSRDISKLQRIIWHHLVIFFIENHNNWKRIWFGKVFYK